MIEEDNNTTQGLDQNWTTEASELILARARAQKYRALCSAVNSKGRFIEGIRKGFHTLEFAFSIP